MRHATKLSLAAAIALGTAALAHEGVKNPTVMARMEHMKAIAGHTKVLGDMAKGARAFDADAAQAAAAALAEEATKTPKFFEAAEDDPKSEAVPTIWTSFPDFTTRSSALVTAAGDATSIASPEELITAFQAIGATCSSCHKAYRE